MELSQNAAYWGGEFDWSTGGEEWSEVWGGSEAQWFGSLYPRLHRYIAPARAILEIAPGYGRWTKYLLSACQEYVGVDLSAECIAACRETFQSAQHARFAVNDGMSLDAAADGSFDFVFCFDSLVHAESDVIENYVPQILRKLTPNGVAFIHHSNLAALGRVANHHARARTVSADLVGHIVRDAGGKILVQERIDWGEARATDCLTLFARREHSSHAGPVAIRNDHFMEEARRIHDFQAPWSRFARYVPAG